MSIRGTEEEGFSLIELVVVVSVLTILAAIVTPQVNKVVVKAKISRLENELKVIKNAVNRLYAELGVYPTEVGQSTDPGLMTNSRIPSNYRINWQGPYLDKWPLEHPWGGTYDYDYRRNRNFDYDNTLGNEVSLTIRNNFSASILNRIDADLDDGSPLTGNIRHNASSILIYYIGEGPDW